LDLDGSESYHIVLHELGTDTHLDLTPDSDYAQQPNFAFSPDGKTLAVLSDEHGQFSLYLHSIETNEKRLLLDIHHPIWDVSWSPDGKWIVAEAEMAASDRGLFVVEVETGRWEQIRADDRYLNAKQPAWSPDSKFLAFSAESGEWFDIGLYEVDTGKITWLTQSTGDDTSPCWSRDGKQISWVHAEGAADIIVSYRRGMPVKRHRVATGIHHHPQFTQEGAILVVFESPKHPPDLWRLNEDGTLERMTNSLPDDLQTGEFVVPEEISYENEGIFIPALLYRGHGNCAVINIHGGPNWQVGFYWDPITVHMASRGWTVLAPNYRGSTGYGRAWQIASRFDLGGVDTRDCAAGVNYLLRANLADTVAVTGRSHGGYLTMTCLTKFPQLWCGGSAVVPFMNWFKSHEDSRQDLQHWNIENMGDPEENYERWYNASPYYFLEKIDSPVQLICGGRDQRCPTSDSLEAHDKLIQLGKDVQLLLYEEEGHSFLKIENVIDSEVKRVEFLAGVLGSEKP
jgi:dipeptidyl aminopeptidase/acylaminoacyl peptidase